MLQCLGGNWQKSKISPLQVRNKPTDCVGSEAIDVHSILSSHHLSSSNVVYDSSLLRREVDLVCSIWILAELLQHARAIFGFNGLKGVAAKLESLCELFLGELGVYVCCSLDHCERCQQERSIVVE